MAANPVDTFDPALLDRILTVYGRKPVLEALADDSLRCLNLHLADSNREAKIIADIKTLAASRAVSVKVHGRKELSRISKNAKQDQGVALDVLCPRFASLEDYLRDSQQQGSRRLLALDGISNPQNLGMIIRSATAGFIDGIVLPRRGCAALGPLVVKASAGTVFRAPIITDNTLPGALKACKAANATICTLDGSASKSLFQESEDAFTVYVMGNESEGVSEAAAELADRVVAIPMRNGVESLNVAVAASLIAFAPAMLSS